MRLSETCNSLQWIVFVIHCTELVKSAWSNRKQQSVWSGMGEGEDGMISTLGGRQMTGTMEYHRLQ